MRKRTFLLGATAISLLQVHMAFAQESQNKPNEIDPKTLLVEWTDATTGRRLRRISTENNSKSLYFHDNAFTADNLWMIYNSPSGVMKAEIGTWKVSPLIASKSATLYEAIMVSRTKPLVYLRQPGKVAQPMGGVGNDYFVADIETGKVSKIASNIVGDLRSVNADDTLMLGFVAQRFYELQPGPKVSNTDGGYNAIGPDGKPLSFAAAKEVRMADRLVQNIPMEIFTINLKTGERRVVTASNDWLNHVQFSPTDPSQIMYCHEGPWHMVDRIWTIKADGTDKRDIHKRTMNMEIAGHEFFSFDGQKILYDLQTPRGEKFWLASYDLKTKHRIWYHHERNEWSVHYQISRDGTRFAGDGGDADMVAHAPDGKWLYLFTPELIEDLGVSAPNAAELIRPGRLKATKVVNMKDHDYRLEPNLQFTPDGNWLVFRSNMHGPIHTYAVDVAGI